MELTLQRIGAWCGPIGMLVYGICFAGIGRMFPPMSPTASADEIAHFLIDHKIWVRIGVAGALVFAASLLPFLATIVLRMLRVEGRWGMLTMCQLFGAMFFTMPMLFSQFLMAAAAYRPEYRPVEITQTLDDLFWMSIVGTLGPFLLQNVTLAVVSFIDRGDPPTFPRWYGYFNVWVALLALPAGALVIFNDGPLAWNGVFAFYLTVTVTFIWLIVTTRILLRAISAEQRRNEPTLVAS
jgi:hypothetical protein